MATAFWAAPTPPHPRELRGVLHLSRERMARLLDVSAKTVERWEEREAAPVSLAARERLTLIQQILELGRVVYTEEGVEQFLRTPLPVFGGRSALKLIEAGQGEQVLAALATDYEGLGS